MTPATDIFHRTFDVLIRRVTRHQASATCLCRTTAESTETECHCPEIEGHFVCLLQQVDAQIPLKEFAGLAGGRQENIAGLRTTGWPPRTKFTESRMAAFIFLLLPTPSIW